MASRRKLTRTPHGSEPSVAQWPPTHKAGPSRSVTPSHQLRITSTGDGRIHGLTNPALDTAAHATARTARNAIFRRLPRIVDLLAHHLLHLAAQLLHDPPDVPRDVALGVARAGEVDLDVGFDAARLRGE